MTNYKRIAVEVGELIKWDVPEPRIGRMGSAVFSFSRDSFPNDSITSVRAQAVYDWILTLARQKMSADLRDKLLAEFCVGIAGDEHRGEAERVLLTNGVSPSVVNKENHEALIGRELHPEVVRHARELFVQGHFFHAVFEVAKAYNKRAREKAQSSKDGQDLMCGLHLPLCSLASCAARR